MKQTNSYPTQKLKLIPGRGLTGTDIKRRLKNRTLVGQTFGDDAYLVDENMDRFMKMSKVEQIEEVRRNQRDMKNLQSTLDEVTNAKNKRQEEQRIEIEINKRLTKIRKEDEAKNKQG